MFSNKFKIDSISEKKEYNIKKRDVYYLSMEDEELGGECGCVRDVG